MAPTEPEARLSDLSVKSKRDRTRENAGKSEASHVKHRLLTMAVAGQAFAWRVRYPQSRILLVDGNAGDGDGVMEDQLDLFGANPSAATPDLLLTIANKLGHATVVLCESDRSRRAALCCKFPNVCVLADHREAPELASDYDYGVWLGDPCGPADQGIDAMQRFGKQVRSDFVTTFNEGFVVARLANTKSVLWEKSRELYLPFANPRHWLSLLDREYMSRTAQIFGSANFRYRVLIIANWLSQAATRRPFIEMIKKVET